MLVCLFQLQSNVQTTSVISSSIKSNALHCFRKNIFRLKSHHIRAFTNGYLNIYVLLFENTFENPSFCSHYMLDKYFRLSFYPIQYFSQQTCNSSTLFDSLFAKVSLFIKFLCFGFWQKKHGKVLLGGQ